VELYFRDGLEEAGTDLQIGERRIRVRARRITRSGPTSGAVLSLEDVTDELRSERILAWGEIARQVAHEVKNPLTPIKLSVQHLVRAWEDRRSDFGDILDKNVEVVLREIDHLADISSSFSRFAAPQAAGREPLERVYVRSVVEEVLALYRSGEGSIDYRASIPTELPPVRARSAELKEVLVNLLENARAAVPDRGQIVVEAEELTAEVEIRVEDNGSGIAPEFLSRIFEPHFSTRSTGTGLGLAIVWNLVESWGGSAAAESGVDEGTVIRIRLLPWTEESKE
jgi:nitrogen fixation/metabolism regulation signal transduction histidine kinase